ncbi:hypothetical protein [Hyphomicrobium sp.]|uniref:hypothetical protein n=1 Tax=Hyphomicrobium sp. TaxID=82 RepID=UPI000FA0F43B|nr:hypothetical protein [Hyphomicrobium sp.]RUP07740.1 MAG: hypothetical protein EKK38_19455 [Hyphomicrobium sp.]
MTANSDDKGAGEPPQIPADYAPEFDFGRALEPRSQPRAKRTTKLAPTPKAKVVQTSTAATKPTIDRHGVYLPAKRHVATLVIAILIFIGCQVYNLQTTLEYGGVKTETPPEMRDAVASAAVFLAAAWYSWAVFFRAWRWHRPSANTPASHYFHRRSAAAVVQALVTATAVSLWMTLPYVGPYIYRDVSRVATKVAAHFGKAPTDADVKIAEVLVPPPLPQTPVEPPNAAPPSVADSTPSKPAPDGVLSAQRKNRVVTGSLPDKKHSTEYPLDDFFRDVGDACERFWTKVIGGGTSAKSPTR